MRQKKEIAILFFLITVLVFYISTRKNEKTHYELPEIQKLAAEDITKITTGKAGSEITIVKEGDTWLIGDNKYPADSAMVQKMISAVSGLTLSALASESKNYAIYELDEKNRIEVAAYKGDNVLRKIMIGKNTPTHRQTFVMIGDDYRVYHSREEVRKDIDRTVPELRDKKVMSFNDEIAEIVLQKGEEELSIIRTVAPVSVDVAEEKEEPQPPSDAGPVWTTADGRTVKAAEAEGIVNTLSGFQCDEFIEDRQKQDFSNPVYMVQLKGQETYRLSFFEKEDNKFPAISSESPYAFLVSEWKAKKIMKEFDSLVESEQ